MSFIDNLPLIGRAKAAVEQTVQYTVASMRKDYPVMLDILNQKIADTETGISAAEQRRRDLAIATHVDNDEAAGAKLRATHTDLDKARKHLSDLQAGKQEIVDRMAAEAAQKAADAEAERKAKLSAERDAMEREVIELDAMIDDFAARLHRLYERRDRIGQLANKHDVFFSATRVLNIIPKFFGHRCGRYGFNLGGSLIGRDDKIVGHLVSKRELGLE